MHSPDFLNFRLANKHAASLENAENRTQAQRARKKASEDHRKDLVNRHKRTDALKSKLLSCLAFHLETHINSLGGLRSIQALSCALRLAPSDAQQIARRLESLPPCEREAPIKALLAPPNTVALPEHPFEASTASSVPLGKSCRQGGIRQRPAAPSTPLALVPAAACADRPAHPPLFRASWSPRCDLWYWPTHLPAACPRTLMTFLTFQELAKLQVASTSTKRTRDERMWGALQTFKFVPGSNTIGLIPPCTRSGRPRWCSKGEIAQRRWLQQFLPLHAPWFEKLDLSIVAGRLLEEDCMQSVNLCRLRSWCCQARVGVQHQQELRLPRTCPCLQDAN